MVQRQKKKWVRRVVIGVLALLMCLGITAYVYLQPYEASHRAIEAMSPNDSLSITSQEDWILFQPADSEGTSVIFYPGGLVEPESYAPLARNIAEQGYPTYIVKMPLDLAVLGINKAEQIIKQQEHETYIIGGHSLGGAMAGRFASNHQNDIKGLFLLASYVDKGGSLASTSMPVLSIIGSNDGIMDKEKLKEGEQYVPKTATFHELNGGNHSQFGSYGFQEGDQKATISVGTQINQTTSFINQWITTNQLK
ncbi:alpha/beta hydrolase [Pontibacillus yanchengensis]|uniref:Alpha/beta hydrolase n=1 Tax=Pontibacillus yanchengensis Y32 TaxID=1385514 RepID=A0A0A2T829_9BACI|nr:alpha/beta hydrolase [Pontibacillus yanchengensis]KGP71942.1 alpha/beta hydrolase [Pontibacillus yanchengensis Y32]